MANTRFEVLFSGNVQGVGFRHTALIASRAFQVEGTVQNLPDGSVQIIVEGTPETIKRFILEVSDSTHGKVHNTDIIRKPPTGEFSAFEIVR